MNGGDARRFDQAVTGVMLNYERKPDKALLASWWAQLEAFPFVDVERALLAHMRDEKFAPRLSDLLDRIPAASNCAFPGPEEAWNLCPKDEATSAWVFPEMLAAYSACEFSRDMGDNYSARRAFVECYEKAIANASGYPQWFISEGNGLRQDERETAKLALLEQHPERAKVGELDDQRHKMAQLTAPAEVAGTLLRLASDAGKAGRELTEDEVRAQVEAKAKANEAIATMKKALGRRTATG